MSLLKSTLHKQLLDTFIDLCIPIGLSVFCLKVPTNSLKEDLPTSAFLPLTQLKRTLIGYYVTMRHFRYPGHKDHQFINQKCKYNDLIPILFNHVI